MDRYSSRIVYAAYNDGENNYELFMMNADGTNDRQLTNNHSFDISPRWSPDGLSIAFSSDQSAADHSEIYLMQADGSGLRRLTYSPENSTAGFPSWKPKRK